MKSPSLSTFRRFLRYLWTYKTTPEGKWLGSSIVVSAFIALASLEIPAYHLLFGLLGLAATAYLVGLLARPTVRIAGRFPEKAAAGHPTTGEFSLTNRSRRTAYDLSVGFFGLPPSVISADLDRAIPSLGRGETAPAPLTLHPRKRGLYPLPEIRAYSTFPLNLCRTAAKLEGGRNAGHSLLVLPSFHPVTAIDVPVSERYQPGGIALASHVGQSPEYIGNREYRPGDPARRIDHRSWARLAMPVVREYQEEYYCRIALVLDTYVTGKKRSKPEGFPDLEAAVSLSAAIADALARGEYIIDIFAAGPELYVFRAGRHTAHFENVLEILACVDACRTNPFDVVTPALADELANISTVIAVFLDWDESREGLMRAAVESGCSVKVLIVRDGETSRPYAELEGVHAVSQYAPADVQAGGIDVL